MLPLVDPLFVASAPLGLLGGFDRWDWLVVVFFLALTTWIGHSKIGQQASMRDFFLGGRRLPWFAVSASIIATEISAVTFVSLPSVVAKEGGNFTYLQLGLVGGLIARAVVAWKLVPAYFEREIYSPYDYMAGRLGDGARKMTTVLFAIVGVFAQAARVYLVAVVLELLMADELAAVERALGMPPLVTAVIAIAGVSVVWTWFGGITAVVWTDAVLFLVFLAGIVLTIATVASHIDGGVGAIAQQGWEAGKFKLWNFGTEPTAAYTFWSALIGVSVWNIGSYGTDQLTAQRIFCCKDQGEAQKAVVWAYAGMSVTLLAGFVGVSLWAWYQAHPMQGEALAMYTDKNDRIFPIYLLQEMPSGMRGLVMAGVFATAISSLDSIMAALSQTVLSAFVLPWRAQRRALEWVQQKRQEHAALRDSDRAHSPAAFQAWLESQATEPPPLDADQEAAESRVTLRLSRLLVVVFAFILAAVAISMERIAAEFQSLLDLALAMATYSAGAFLAGFLLAFWQRRLGINGRGYLYSAPLSVLIVFSLSWHNDTAIRYASTAAGVLVAAYLALEAASQWRRAPARTVVRSVALIAAAWSVRWLAQHGTFTGADGSAANLAFTWHPLLGTLVAFGFGWLLSEPVQASGAGEPTAGTYRAKA